MRKHGYKQLTVKLYTDFCRGLTPLSPYYSRVICNDCFEKRELSSSAMTEKTHTRYFMKFQNTGDKDTKASIRDSYLISAAQQEIKKHMGLLVKKTIENFKTAAVEN